MKTTNSIVEFYKESPGVHSLKELEAIGAYPNLVRNMMAHGQLEEVARGLYRLAGQDESEHADLEAIAVAVPQGVALQALRAWQLLKTFHGEHLPRLRFMHGASTLLELPVWKTPC